MYIYLFLIIFVKDGGDKRRFSGNKDNLRCVFTMSLCISSIHSFNRYFGLDINCKCQNCGEVIYFRL